VETWPEPGHEDLYAVHFASLMRIGFCLTGSNEVAEDLVQDTFLRCSGRLATVDDPGSYLRAALVNACRSHHRRTQMASRTDMPAPANRSLPADLIELRDVLLRLPERQRAAIVLRYLVDLDDEQIAKTLGCRRATVRSLVHRGLAQLREDLP
jgi:RNA polymerase sigma factor (sigma-70 family)